MQTWIDKGTINSQDLLIALADRTVNKKDFILVDVRENSEYNASHIKGVDYLQPLSTQAEWEDALFEQMKDKVIIFTCYSGARSGDIQEVFKAKGHTKTLNHVGGIASYSGELVK